jgi:soluble lytic murein transglycosylase-like protein
MDPLTVAILTALAANEAQIDTAQPPISGKPGAQDAVPMGRWTDDIAEAARRFSLPESWIRAVTEAESAGNPEAVSPKGAMGLMQLMPEAYRQMRAEYGLGADPFDPRDNIMAGSAFLRKMLDRFGEAGFLAAYNAGPERYAEVLSGAAPLPEESLAFQMKVAPRIAVDPVSTAMRGPGPGTGGLFFASSRARLPDQSWRQILVPVGGHGNHP